MKPTEISTNSLLGNGIKFILYGDSQNNNMNDQGEIDRILSTTECKNVLLVGDIFF